MDRMNDDSPTLEQDASLDEPLRRVAYEAGMMLGLEAVRDEQHYHRRRLTRHQYWLHGFGTLAGMAVRAEPASHPNPDDHITVRLIVGPGLGIDGLGREVLVHEPYCVHLGEWIAAQSQARLAEGHDAGSGRLWLKVTVRQRECQVARQPVLARKLNLGTDAVQPSRIADSVQIELIPELPPADTDDRYRPWGGHPPVSGDIDDTPPELTAAEHAQIAAVGNEVHAAQLRMHARLLHALDDSGVTPRELATRFEDGARLLLARISLEADDIDDIVVNPQRISINNLVRPFLTSASQLAWLARQP
ncbi:hypothetical protein [Halomonas sp. BM-2019]|uniref:hypothetical protein n=1 Tax=Halomonas sp. BM-2019 TaxID=2811227 RepID=UPI001B3C2508|nr:MAG: hypothetical protein J5F18_09770 [Halomonas sp. BM-2019]